MDNETQLIKAVQDSLEIALENHKRLRTLELRMYVLMSGLSGGTLVWFLMNIGG